MSGFPLRACFLISLLSVLILGGCLPAEVTQFFTDLQGKSEQKTEGESDRGIVAEDVVIMTPKERRRFYRFFLKEMYREIYARELQDKQVYRNWMNVLEQGASIEGVYRGLTLSGEYRAMERGKASPAAVRFFALEAAALKLPGEANAAKRKSLAAELEKRAQGMPLFALKRLLGEELLSKITRLEKSGRENLALWYAATAVRWRSLGVDFLLEQRNTSDRGYYERWAVQNTLGRIQWETLFRMHRLMNKLGGIVYSDIKESGQSPQP